MPMNPKLLRPRASGTPASLLLRFDGTNGSTSFVDSSPNALTVTAYGDAQISTAQSKFGGASGYFDGDGDYLSIAQHPALALGSLDFTIEMWVYLNSTDGWILGMGDAATAAGSALSWYHGVELTFYFDGESSASLTPPSWTLGQWQHLAVVRNGGTITAYLDGVADSSASIGSGVINDVASPLQIGYYAAGSMYGYIDDFRIVRGLAVYGANGNFTPPTGPLSAYANPQ